MSPSSGVLALSTLVTLSVGDGWAEEVGNLYRFGLLYYLNDNSSSTVWLQQSSSMMTRIILPSASSAKPACGRRVAYSALLEVCDRRGACHVAVGKPFQVAKPENITVATALVTSWISADVANGNLFSALHKISSLDEELCEEGMDGLMADKVASALLNSIDTTSESSEYREVLSAITRLMNVVSDKVLEEIIDVLDEYRTRMGMLSPAPRTMREKRETVPAVATQTSSDTAMIRQAEDLLKMYDLLMAKNQPVVEVFFSNIQDSLIKFCVKLDEKSTRIITATGEQLTKIAAQSVAPSQAAFLAMNFSVAGPVDNAVVFLPPFVSLFSHWQCSDSIATCSHVCLASARVNSSAASFNQYLSDYLFPSKFIVVTFNRSASEFFLVTMVDPLSGKPVAMTTPTEMYSIRIPLTKYKSVNYYQCFIFSNPTGWSSLACASASFATVTNSGYFLQCNCSTTGLIGVFAVSPPIPPSMPPHSEIRITLQLSTSIIPSTNESNVCVSRLSSESALEGRLVNSSGANSSASGSSFGNSSGAWLSLTLRPPFRPDQLSNSYALQSILRAVDRESGFVAYSKVTVLNATFEVEVRKLNGDGNARKIMMKVGSFSTSMANSTDTLENRWPQQLADALGVSPYRFKNPRIVLTMPSILFNFTITLPFDQESVPLSAEEIAAMIMESTRNKELEFLSTSGDRLRANEVTTKDIVELRVARGSNTLVVVLVVVISTVLLISSLYIGGAVVVKIRTDRLLEEERSRMVLVDPMDVMAPPPPMYGESVGPAADQVRHGQTTRTRHA